MEGKKTAEEEILVVVVVVVVVELSEPVPTYDDGPGMPTDVGSCG
jgi:hypothetical protein